jgi:hypothetical protein
MRTPVALSSFAAVFAVVLVAPRALADEPPHPPLDPIARALAPKPPTEPKSPGMMVTGIVLWAASASMTGVGTARLLSGSTCAEPAIQGKGGAQPLSAQPREQIGVARQAMCGDSSSTVGLGLLIAGQLMSVIAIPIFVVGVSRVPLGRGMAKLSLPELRVGAARATLLWTF